MDNKLGIYVKKEREKLGISQRELAKRIFVDNKTINKIERGITKKIDFETLSKLSKIFNISIYEIGKKANYEKIEIDEELTKRLIFPINNFNEWIITYNFEDKYIDKYTYTNEENIRYIDIEKVLNGYKNNEITIEETIILINACRPIDYKENELIYPTENGNIKIEY